MSYNYESAGIAVLYTATILGVMYWSGGSVEKTIYNRYLVAAESTSVPTADLARSSRFMREVLQFPEVAPKVRNPEEGDLFLTPGGFYLAVRPNHASTGAGGYQTEIVFRVRNGFSKLRTSFENRLRDFLKGSPQSEPGAAGAAAAKGPLVTPVLTRPAGDEFTVVDPDGNRFVFFLPRRSVPRT